MWILRIWSFYALFKIFPHQFNVTSFLLRRLKCWFKTFFLKSLSCSGLMCLVGQISTDKFFWLMKTTCTSIHEAYLTPRPMRHFQMRCNFLKASSTSINVPKLLSLPKNPLKVLNTILWHWPPKWKNSDTDYEDHLKLTFTRITLPETVIITLS